MNRLNRIDDLLFPVNEHPVFARITTKDGERHVAIPEKKAIINSSTGGVLGVVGRDYRLVSNQQALEWARVCCRQVFPESKEAEWDVQATDGPRSGGHCAIDLRHNSTALDFKLVPARDRPEVFGPFIRVTNSYNALRALTFDIGFYRKVCQNGLILPETVITFKFVHSRRQIGEQLEFEIDHNKLAKLKASLDAYLRALHECPVPADHFGPLVKAVLRIGEISPGASERDVNQWQQLDAHLTELRGRYADELGWNAYAVFNVATEFASRPLSTRWSRRERHGYQRLVGQWTTDFHQQSQQPDFNLNRHIQNLRRAATRDAMESTSA